MVIEEEEDESSSRIDCPVLVTERLILRAPHVDDVPELSLLAANRRVAEMVARMPHPYGEAEARAFVAASAKRRQGCVYALTLSDTGAFIGCAALNETPRGLELGYWVGEPFWNRGFATEAAHALVDLAFRVTDVDCLHVSCRVLNGASRRVIQKCGFNYAGQGMIDSIAAGRVAVERYELDRKTWASLRSWASAERMRPR